MSLMEPAKRRELGVVVAADGDAARQLAGRDATGHLHRLHQRAGHAAAHLPCHQRGDEQRRAAGDDEVAPAGPEPADVAGQEDGEGATQAKARRQALALRLRQGDRGHGVDQVARPPRHRLPRLDRRHVDVLTRARRTGSGVTMLPRRSIADDLGILELEGLLHDAQRRRGTWSQPWRTSGSRPRRPAAVGPGCAPRCGSG